MNDAVFSSEGPLPLGSSAHPSERTEHQSSEKVNRQTSPKEVLLVFCLKVLKLNLCYKLFNVHYCFSSYRGVNMTERIGERHNSGGTEIDDNIQELH